MNKMYIQLFAIIILIFVMNACTQQVTNAPTDPDVKVIRSFNLNDTDLVITKDNVQVDTENVSEGNGSLKAIVGAPTTIRLFEVSDLDVDDGKILFQAKLKSQNLKGQAYLEMWVHLPEEGEFFSRGLEDPITGTTDWTMKEIPFLLKKGQKPDLVKLNVVINGKGTVWIDDVRILKAPATASDNINVNVQVDGNDAKTEVEAGNRELP